MWNCNICKRKLLEKWNFKHMFLKENEIFAYFMWGAKQNVENKNICLFY